MFWRLLYLAEQETGQTLAISPVDSSPSSRNTPAMFVPSGTFPTFPCDEQTDSVFTERLTAEWNACTVKPSGKETYALLCRITHHCDSRVHVSTTCRSFATRVSKLKIWHFWGVTGIERNVCRGNFNRYSVITQFAKLAAGEQLCRRCTHRKLQHFKTFKSISWKITHFWVVVLLAQMRDIRSTAETALQTLGYGPECTGIEPWIIQTALEVIQLPGQWEPRDPSSG